GHAPAEIGQPLDDRVLALVEREAGVVALEVAEGALGCRQLALQEGDLGLEEVARLTGELELRLQPPQDVAARMCVGDALREPGAWTGEADLDEARVVDGLPL